MPRTSVKIWQRSARRAAASATAVVSQPPRPSVVISFCPTAASLWPWKPATMTTLPASISSRTRRGSMLAMRARPYRPSVVIPACGPVRLMAAIAERVERHREQRRRLVLARGEQDVELARVGVVGDGRGEPEQLVGRVAHGADTTTTRSWPGRALARDAPRDPLDAVGVGDGRATEFLDDEGGRHRGAFYRPAPRGPRGHVRRTRCAHRHEAAAPTRDRLRCVDPAHRGPDRCASISTADRPSRRSPAARSTARGSTLTAADGNRFAAFRARAADADAGPAIADPARRPRPPPVLRGAGAAVRRARHRRARDRLVRADRRRPTSAATTSSTCRTSQQTTWAGIAADIAAGVAALRAPTGDRPARRASSRSGSAWAAGCRSCSATLGLGPRRRHRLLRHARRAVAQRRPGAGRRRGARSRRRCSGLFGGADRASQPRRSRRSTRALTAAGTDHRLVTYPGAPHSFFDRKAAEFAARKRGRLGRDPRVRGCPDGLTSPAPSA